MGSVGPAHERLVFRRLLGLKERSVARIPCPACGSFNEEYSCFCDQCGTSLRDPARRREGRGARAIASLLLLAAVAVTVAYAVRHPLAPKGSPEEKAFEEASKAPSSGEAPRGAQPAAGVDSAAPAGSAASVEKVEEEPAYPEVTAQDLAAWAEVVTVGEGERQIFSCAGAVLQEGLLLCPVEALPRGRTLRIRWGRRSFTVTAAVGWDLDRGFCLLPLPEGAEAGGYAVGLARPGDGVSVVNRNGKGVEATLGDPEAYGIEGLPVLVVVENESQSGASFLLRSNEVVGVAWYRWPGRGFDLFGTVLEPDRGEELSIADWNDRVWAPSAYSDLTAGRDAFLEGDFARAACLLSDAVSKKEALRPLAIAYVIDAYVKWAAVFSAAGELEKARDTLLAGLKAAPQSKEILLALSREEAALGYLRDALDHARQALALDEELWRKRWPILEERYLRLAATLPAEEAERLLGEGIEELPESADLRVELGGLLFKDRRFIEAIGLWEEAYELSRDPEIGKLIEEARRVTASEESVVVIPIPESGGTIRTGVLFAGRLEVMCIVDTGATYTAIPEWAAAALNIAPEEGRRVRIATASGIREEVPIVTIPSVGLGKLEVAPLDVIILDLPHGPNERSLGLLGLNFLNHFNASIDRDRKELRIAPR